MGQRDFSRLISVPPPPQCSGKYHLPAKYALKNKRLSDGSVAPMRVCWACYENVVRFKFKASKAKGHLVDQMMDRKKYGHMYVPIWQSMKDDPKCLRCDSTHKCRFIVIFSLLFIPPLRSVSPWLIRFEQLSGNGFQRFLLFSLCRCGNRPDLPGLWVRLLQQQQLLGEDGEHPQILREGPQTAGQDGARSQDPHVSAVPLAHRLGRD